MSLDNILENAGQKLGVADAWRRLADYTGFKAQNLWPIAASVGGKLFVYGGDSNNEILTSPEGRTWTTLKGNWPARPLPGGAAHNGKLYIVGGDKKADTWASADGVQWSQVGGPAAWGPRYWPAMTSFKGHLYLMGGVKGDRPQDDVWALEPEGTWRLVKAKAFDRRVNAAAGVVGSSLLLLGGRENLGGIAESLVSPDGENWISYPVPWAGRFGAAAVTIGDTLYLMGGQAKQDGPALNDVWATKDGIGWSRVDASMPSLSQSAGAAVGDQLVVLGGLAGKAQNSEVYGLQPRPSGWQPIGKLDRPGRLIYAATLEFSGRFWALDGNADYPVVACSDGVTWRKVESDLPYRGGAAATVHNNAMWICGGDNGAKMTNEVRTSADGVTWSVVTASAGWSPRRDHCMVSYGGKLYVMAGQGDGSPQNDVWSSPDGATWTRLTAGAFGPVGRVMATAAVFAGRMWVFGGYDSSQSFQETWSSTDGKTWEKRVPPWAGRFDCGACQIGDMLYVVDGCGRAAAMPWKDVWGTRDGITWSCFSAAAPWGDLGGSQYVALDGALVMFGGTSGPPNQTIYRFQPM